MFPRRNPARAMDQIDSYRKSPSPRAHRFFDSRNILSKCALVFSGCRYPMRYTGHVQRCGPSGYRPPLRGYRPMAANRSASTASLFLEIVLIGEFGAIRGSARSVGAAPDWTSNDHDAIMNPSANRDAPSKLYPSYLRPPAIELRSRLCRIRASPFAIYPSYPPLPAIEYPFSLRWSVSPNLPQLVFRLGISNDTRKESASCTPNPPYACVRNPR